MITVNQTPLDDNQLIRVIRITLDSTVIRLCYHSKHEDITLSSNVYYGSKIVNDSLSISPKSISASQGGIGDVIALEFTLKRFGGYYLNDFTPYGFSRKVEIGFMWEGATLESQITWEYNCYIEDIKAVDNGIYLFCPEMPELDIMQLPYYEVQEEINNGISYYPKAPEDSFGQPLPIVIGDFYTNYNPAYNIFNLVPTVTVDENKLIFQIASHKVHTLNELYGSYKYLSQAETFMIFGSAVNAATNTNYGTLFSVLPTPSRVYGSVWLQFKRPGKNSNVADIRNAVDNSQLTYAELTRAASGDETWITFQLDSSLSTSELGRLGQGETNIRYVVELSSSEDETTNDYRLFYRIEDIKKIDDVLFDMSSTLQPTGSISSTTPAIDFMDFGNYVGGDPYEDYPRKRSKILPWTIEELQELEFCIQNESDNSTQKTLRVHNAYLNLTGILLTSVINKIPVYYPRPRIGQLTYTKLYMAR